MLEPQPHDGPPQWVRDRQRIENLHRLLNRSEAGRRIAERDRDLARWRTILDANKIAALEEEVERLRSELNAPAGNSRKVQDAEP